MQTMIQAMLVHMTTFDVLQLLQLLMRFLYRNTYV